MSKLRVACPSLEACSDSYGIATCWLRGVLFRTLSGCYKPNAPALVDSPEHVCVCVCVCVCASITVIDGDEIIYRDYIDISIAVATPKGLVVPVLRAADKLSFADCEKVSGA